MVTTPKQRIREEANKAVADFIAKGGKIEIVDAKQKRPRHPAGKAVQTPV